MLSSINMYNSLLGNQQASINAADKVAPDDAAVAKAQVNQETDGNLSLSTRAQKFSAITREFFSGKSFASIDTAKLIDRVYEYGLMSKSEYETLSSKSTATDDTEIVETTSTASLSRFLDQFDQRLSGVEGYQDAGNERVVALKQALNHASLIFQDVEQAKKSDDFKSDLASSRATLTELLNTEAFKAMPINDKVDMANVIKTLDVIDKINVKRLDNPMINRYISVANY